MRKLTLFFACLFLMFSCKNETDTDDSLTVKEYRASGLPDPGKVWDSGDYSMAFAVLENLKNTTPNRLPRKNSRKSGEVFERMLSLKSLSSPQDNSIPYELKLSETRNFLKTCEKWIFIYTNPGDELQYYHRELTELYLFGLKLTEITLEIPNTMPDTYVAEEEGLGEDPVRLSYLSILFNLLRLQTEKISQFSSTDHEMLAEGIITSINKNKSWLDEMTKNDLTDVLNVLINAMPYDQVNEKYMELLESM